MKSFVKMSFTIMRRLLFGAIASAALPFYLVLCLVIIVVTSLADGLSYLHDWSHGRTEGRGTFCREFWAERVSHMVEEGKLIVAIVCR